MNGAKKTTRPAIAPPEEDPNATVVCNSPPCFLHELEPSWLGHVGRDEVLALLRRLLSAEWPGTRLETAWLRAMLRRHLARLGGTPHGPDDGALACDETGAGPRHPVGGLEEAACRLREALPRLQDDALRGDLAQVLGMMERDMRRSRRHRGRD